MSYATELERLEAELEARTLEKRLCELSFRDFIFYAWESLEPGNPLKPGWHIDAICEHLQAVQKGEIQRLIINIPPGTTKSMCATVLFPVWLWINRPEERLICASYSGELAVEHSMKRRDLMRSEWFRDHWGDKIKFQADENAKGAYRNTRQGKMYSTGLKGTITGKHAHTLITDDPISPEEANSDAELMRIKRIWNETLPTRFLDHKTARQVLIMQRLHEEDPTGLALADEDDDWVLLRIPMEYEADNKCVTPIGWEDPRMEEGELLNEERFPREVVERLKRKLGSRAAAGQLQQRPAAKGGNIFKRSWFGLYKFNQGNFVTDEGQRFSPNKLFSIAAADPAWSENQEADYSCAIAARGDFVSRNLFIVDYHHEQWESQHTKRALLNMWRTNTVKRFGIEETENRSKRLIEDLQIEGMPAVGLKPFDYGGDKVSRAHSATPFLEQRKLWLPHDAPWIESFLKELTDFPNAKHDDRADTLTYLVLMWAKRMLDYSTALVHNAPGKNIHKLSERGQRALKRREEQKAATGF